MFSCKSFKTTQKPVNKDEQLTETPSEIVDVPVYNSSEKKINDLLHTKLEISFSWEKRYLYGKAELTLKPYFYPTSTLTLDAKGFDIHKIELVNENKNIALTYKYDSLHLEIALNKEYNRNETYKVNIEYTAKPYEREVSGSDAISEDRGLYFVNHDGKEKNIPQQIWTQGETEASSCWFPTIDVPNEKMTQEIYVTVDTGFVSLSNGLLMYYTLNGDGTHTDYWRQDLPHAPYLTMLAIGKYAIVKDTWRDSIEVSYYVEPEYEKHAKMIFGHTPEMLEFFSKLLGVDYPWAKYSQVTVRNFVSGAMENTSATVIRNEIQQDEREYLDENYEDYISHELFHHWFGDLVTCESWANLPLNESFASYGEYLWNEYKFGNDHADFHFLKAMRKYLNSSKYNKHNLIRFYYNDKEEMFDNHSYEKGSCVLHMLRNYVGDTAFFQAIEKYLDTYKFGTAEIHNLRMAFEEVTGEDLNWFFNQWFLSSGHPELEIKSEFDETSGEVKVAINQVQDLSTEPLFEIPFAIDIYGQTGKFRHNKIIKNQNEIFTFKVSEKPKLVNVDADKIILCSKKEDKPDEQWIYQYYNAPLFIDRYEALEKIASKQSIKQFHQTMLDALSHKFWATRLFAVKNIKIDIETKNLIKEKLVTLAKNDEKSSVRAEAIEKLSSLNDSSLIQFFEDYTNDKSYTVAGVALLSLGKLSAKLSLNKAKEFESSSNNKLISKVSKIYSDYGDSTCNKFFCDLLSNKDNDRVHAVMVHYGKYLLRMNDNIINTGLDLFENMSITSDSWFIRYSSTQIIKDIAGMYKEKENNFKSKSSAKTNSKGYVNSELQNCQNQLKKIDSILKKIKVNEKDKTLTELYKSEDNFLEILYEE